MATEGNKEQIAYLEAKKKYLAIGKRYSSLLQQMMELDPNVLKIAEDILVTGDNLSIHDNTFLTSFYKELKIKSKIDKKYYDFLLELKKTKNELDNSVALLSKKRISYLLRKSGIPPRRTNQSIDMIASQINSPSTGLLEKISLPGVLDVELSESLDDMIVREEIELISGQLVPRTREAREFVRNLEKKSQQKINNDYFISPKTSLLAHFGKINSSNLLEFIRVTADQDHIREIERKIATGDIEIIDGKLIANTAKGKKYILLLVEELTACLNKKLKTEMLEANKLHMAIDPRLKNVENALQDLDIKLKKHNKIRGLATGNETFSGAFSNMANKKQQIEHLFADLITIQETVSASFSDIKKQLLIILNKDKVDVEKVLSLLVAVRYLSLYENKYEEKLTSLEGLLGLSGVAKVENFGPDTVSRLAERYDYDTDTLTNELDSLAQELVEKRLNSRKELGPEINIYLSEFLKSSPQAKSFMKTTSEQHIVKKHLLDTLYTRGSLYTGLGNLTELLAEITELEIEKREKLTDVAHELELAHKEFWLSKIGNNNISYIKTNFDTLQDYAQNKAISASKDAILAARKEIRETLSRHRNEYKKHSDEFAKLLRQSLRDISKGGDVIKISNDLKTKYSSMVTSQDKIMANMEKDIIALENRLLDFEKNVPGELEKMLISDIRSSI